MCLEINNKESALYLKMLCFDKYVNRRDVLNLKKITFMYYLTYMLMIP